METEALFKNSWICLLIVCGYWLSHYMRRALISGCAMFRQRSRADRVTIQSIYSYCSLGLSGLLLDTVMRVSLQVQGHFTIVTEQPLCDRQHLWILKSPQTLVSFLEHILYTRNICRLLHSDLKVFFPLCFLSTGSRCRPEFWYCL